MSVDEFYDPGSSFETGTLQPEEADPGPLGPLPLLSARQARLEWHLARDDAAGGFHDALGWVAEASGARISIERPEVFWRPSGVRRAGVVAQLGWPRLATRVGVGLDTAVAHALVDGMLGYERPRAEGRLAVSPVEWGILTYVVAEALRRLSTHVDGPLGVWDLSIDRVGPDPFDVSGLGQIVTLRWPLTVGTLAGSLRLWLPEPLVARWLLPDPPVCLRSPALATRFTALTSDWRAEAGTVSLPRGLRTIRAGGVLPLLDSRLRGTPQSPTGPVLLTLDLTGEGVRFLVAAEPVPFSGGGRLTVTAPLERRPIPREALPVPPSSPTPPPSSSPTPAPEPATSLAGPADVPVTLVVELGRVNLPLGRLADLKPGDVVQLGRHSREPVELTSGGRLIARGELVQIDTELGVRVTQVFL